jgi:hypothetical protein
MKTHKELKLTKTQHKNLAKLTIFVRNKVAPPKFNINRFFISKDGEGHCFDDAVPSCEDYQCGTSACFLGYAVLADIKPKKDETWETYGRRCFGIHMNGDLIPVPNKEDIYHFLFDEKHKNSKSAAVKRGAYFLMSGLPENVNLKTWETPRSFKPDWASIEKLANS